MADMAQIHPIIGLKYFHFIIALMRGEFFKVSDGQYKDYLEYIIGMIMFWYDNEMDPYRYLYGELGRFKAIERVSFHEPLPDDNPHITY